VEGDTLAGQSIYSILDGIAGTGQVTGEGTKAHARAAETFEFGEVDQTLGIVVNREGLD
jgi:hypothetical protein